MKSLVSLVGMALLTLTAFGGELQDAAGRGDVEKVLSLLTSNPALVNVREAGTTALHEATRAGQLSMVKLLVSRGANVNATDFSGLTPLKLALGRRNMEIADFLRQNGGLEKTPPTAVTRAPSGVPSGTTPLGSASSLFAAGSIPQHARSKPNSPSVVSPPSTPTNKPPTETEMLPVIFPIHEAARIGEVEQIKFLFKSAPDLIDATDEKGRTPLHIAAANKQLRVVQVLLGLGANVNARAMNGQTPLHAAARLGDTAIAGLLITNRAVINALDTYRNTPLLLALQSSNSETLDNPLLSETKFGVTNSVLAIQRQQLDLARLLLAHRADVNVVNRAGATPLMEAVRIGNEPVASALIQSGANPNTSDRASGTTPLHLAAARGQAAIAQLLLSAGAAVNALDMRGDTPLCSALREGRANTIGLLRKAGGNTGPSRILSPMEKSLVDFYERTESILRGGSAAEKSRVLQAMNPGKADTERMFPKHADTAWKVVEELNRQIKQAFARPLRDADVTKEIWRILPEPPSPATQEWRRRGWLASDLPVLSLAVDKTGGTTRPGDYCFVNNHWVLVPPLGSIAAPTESAETGRRK